jgi:hypothetical protein
MEICPADALGERETRFGDEAHDAHGIQYMTLRQKQSIFALRVARLILKANEMGYEVTFAEAYRSPEEAARQAKAKKGIAQSLHTQRLAIDLNLFKDGVYLSSSESHRPLGEWWERQSTEGADCCWGGRFHDGNHYSIAHDGRK